MEMADLLFFVETKCFFLRSLKISNLYFETYF